MARPAAPEGGFGKGSKSISLKVGISIPLFFSVLNQFIRL
jgi:hypothetical protein